MQEIQVDAGGEADSCVCPYRRPDRHSKVRKDTSDSILALKIAIKLLVGLEQDQIGTSMFRSLS